MLIYADNAATTQLDADAFEAMKPFLLDCYANASQPYNFSRKAKHAVNNARKTIAECINAEPEQIYFTSGGTESDNWAIKCFCNPHDIRHIITSAIEHHAVLNACNSNYNANCYLLDTDTSGMINPDDLLKILNRPRECAASCESTLVSIMLANNEIGTIQPIKELAEVAHQKGAIFHTDAVQAVGHIPIDVNELGVDMLSASAHKFNGPKGIGFLYSKNLLLQSFHNGGSQEFGMRAGTENIAAIVGMAVALKKNLTLLTENTKHIDEVSQAFLSTLNSSKIDYIINGNQKSRLPGNINISLKNKSGERILHLLDLKGICISTGSACDSVNQQVSHVIKAIKVPAEYAEGTIRISFGKNNTIEEAVIVAQTIIKVISL